MGFQLVFDLYEIFCRGEEIKKIKFNNLDEILSMAEKLLMTFHAEKLENEEYNLFISYLKNQPAENKIPELRNSQIDNKNSQIEIKKNFIEENIKSLEKKNPLIMFEGVILFESIEKNFSSILVKQQNEIIINQGDKKLIEICEKMQILQIKQSFIIKFKKFKIGDYFFKLGSVFQIKSDKIKYTKSILLEVEIPFLNSFEDSKNILFELISSIFQYDYLDDLKKKQEKQIDDRQNLDENRRNEKSEEKFHFYEESLEKIFKEKNNINNHWNFLQYTNVILLDTQTKLNLIK